jgi:hypothetical protein
MPLFISYPGSKFLQLCRYELPLFLFLLLYLLLVVLYSSLTPMPAGDAVLQAADSAAPPRADGAHFSSNILPPSIGRRSKLARRNQSINQVYTNLDNENHPRGSTAF